MKVISMEDIEGRINKRGVEAKKLLKNEDVQIMNLNLEPGDEIPSHSVPVNVFFYVVSGSGTIEIGNEKAVVEEKDIVPEVDKPQRKADEPFKSAPGVPHILGKHVLV